MLPPGHSELASKKNLVAQQVSWPLEMEDALVTYEDIHDQNISENLLNVKLPFIYI